MTLSRQLGEVGAEFERQLGEMRSSIPPATDLAGVHSRLDEMGRAFEQRILSLGDVLAMSAELTALRNENAELRKSTEEYKRQIQFPSRFDVRAAGIKLDDPSAATTNAKILNDIAKRVGCRGDDIREEIYLPGGAIYFDDTWNLSVKTGGSVVGNGIALSSPNSWYLDPRGRGGAASRLVYIGPAEKPAVVYASAGLDFSYITIQRGEAWKAPKRDGSIALRIMGNNGVPTGKLTSEKLAIYGFDTAIHASAEPREWHADTCKFKYLICRDYCTLYRCDNQQAVGQVFEYIECGGIPPEDGSMPIVFDIQRAGGRFNCDKLFLMEPALVLRQGFPSDGDYWFGYFETDPRAKGWRFLEMLQGGGIVLRVKGQIGRGSDPGPEPIVLRKMPTDPTGKTHNLEINLVQQYKPFELARTVK